MKLASRKISIRTLLPIMVFGLAVLLAPVGVFAQTDPVARNDYAVTPFNMPITIDVAYNDYDLDGDLNLSSVEIFEPVPPSPTHGTAVSNHDGTIAYTPPLDFPGGRDSFQYEICDDTGPCATATVTVQVLEAGTVPVSFDVIPKKLNMNKKGVVPFVIRSTEEVKVTSIDLDSIEIMIDPSSPQGINLKKPAKAPGHSNRINLKIGGQDILQEILDAFGEVFKGDEITLYLFGNIEGDPEAKIFGQDTVIITGQPKKEK